jgi:hypothetical protein
MTDASPALVSTDLRRFVWSRIVVALSALAVLAASYLYAPFANGGPVLCPLHGLIGLPCPSCGLTRAFCRLARMDVWGALSFHAFSLPLFALFMLTPGICAYEVIRRRTCRLHALAYSPRLAWGLAVLWMAYHTARVSIWFFDGTLVTDYLKTSWTYALFKAAGLEG